MVLVEGLSDEDQQQLENELTIVNPKIATMRRWSGWVPSNVPRFLHGYVRAPEGLYVAPGYAWRAWQLASRDGVAELAPNPHPFEPRSIGLTFNGQLRPYQQRVVRETMTTRRCSILVPTGGGKTELMVYKIVQRDVPALVLVHNKELMRQWVARFEKLTGYTPATYGGRKKAAAPLTGDEPVIIGMVQSVVRSKSIIAMLARTRQYVVQEEAHHTPATTFNDIHAQLHPRYVDGITATAMRADGLTPLMFWWLGPIRSQITIRELIAEGYYVQPDVCVYTSNFKHQFNRDDTGGYDGMLSAMVAHLPRLQWLVECIVAAVKLDPQRQHLVRCGRLEYVELIAAALRGHGGLDVEMLTGDPKITKPKHRDAVVARLVAQTLPVVVTTSVCDEGLDVPTLTDVWMATPIKDPSRVTQLIGRLTRPSPGKPRPRIHDIVDPEVLSYGVDQRSGMSSDARTLMNGFRTRYAKVYRETCAGGLPSCQKLIEEWKGR